MADINTKAVGNFGRARPSNPPGKALATCRQTLPAGTREEAGPSDTIWRLSGAGWLIILAFFGGLGTWSMTAPLNGAVVAPGVLKVEGNRKSIQHLDGGIVKELRVNEGDRIKAGDVLIVLDDSQARTEFDVYSHQYVVLRATEERLRSELARASQLTVPDDLKGRMNESDVRSVWEGQVSQIKSRLAALEGQRKVIREKIAQLEAQIVGAEGTLKAYRAQLRSAHQEMDLIRPLVEKGLVTKPRYLQLERGALGVEGQIADTLAVIAKSRQAIAEQQQQMAQLDNDRMTEVTKDLRDTQAQVLQVVPKLANARAVLSRIEIRSPYTGRVVGLNVFSMGGVIGKGEKILDVVPDEESLVVEAQVAVDDISDVRPNMQAQVHLTAYKQRITPTVNGQIFQISADRLVDQKTGNPYYVALIRLDREQLAQLPQVQLYPGMPAQVMIPTTERTAFDYLVGPLVQSFNHAFRQR